MKRKSYNPFKMWGSWVGGFLGFTYPVLFMLIEINQQGYEAVSVMVSNSLIVTGFIGFLIGWGIHSLVRLNK